MGQFLCPILHLPLQGMCELPFVSSMDPHLIATTAHMRSHSKKKLFSFSFFEFLPVCEAEPVDAVQQGNRPRGVPHRGGWAARPAGCQ